MLIYSLVFGQDYGQVNCVFHDDSISSAGIGPNGEYNCFACGAKAHNAVGFIAKYFNVSINKAQTIFNAHNRVQNYRYTKNKINDEQRKYLHSIGLIDEVIDKYFFQSGVGKLMYAHTWNGIDIGYTWFNSPLLSNYSASDAKYKYDKNNIGGSLTPYDDVIKYDTLVICEGEKDMLTAKSVGVPNAVAKIGGAISYLIGGVNLYNKKIIIVYDCDDAGIKGALQDANILVEKFQCQVKIINLGLPDKEDLNDYFIKHHKTIDDFYTLVKDTPLHVVTEATKKQNKIQEFVSSLSKDELETLKNIIGGNNNE